MNQGKSSIAKLLAGRSTSHCRHSLGSTGCLSEARAFATTSRLTRLQHGLLHRESTSGVPRTNLSAKLWPTSFRSYTNRPMRAYPAKELATADSTSVPEFILIRAPTPYQAFIKPILFTAATTFGVFALAAYVWERRQVTLLKRIQAWRSRSKDDRLAAHEFAQEQLEIVQEQWKTAWERFRWIQQIGLPVEVQKMLFMMKSRWMELSHGEKTIYGIIGLNSIVFAAWQVPRLSSFMHKWFMHHPASGRSITLLTSMFSHQHFWHFGLNMFALYSFAIPIHDHMGREQFLAFYTTTGVTASLISHLFTAARLPWVKMIPSLGASGAIFGCVSATAYMYPDASVYLIFLPFFPIKIPMALGAMMSLDLLGIIRGWKFFDHYAHLAGSTFGLAYMYAGKEFVWTPLSRMAIEFNKDSNLFGKSSQSESARPNSWSQGGVVVDNNTSSRNEGERTAKDYAQARYERIKSWWDSKRNGGGNKEA
ncbi:hypothetical protein B0O80DRAFT_528338 [Mortierella sp. GBAus27b]|nr:hypothetical protein B0O80DRAFT_528338 [Mortierella sp. GBAus27b]